MALYVTLAKTKCECLIFVYNKAGGIQKNKELNSLTLSEKMVN